MKERIESNFGFDLIDWFLPGIVSQLKLCLIIIKAFTRVFVSNEMEPELIWNVMLTLIRINGISFQHVNQKAKQSWSREMHKSE